MSIDDSFTVSAIMHYKQSNMSKIMSVPGVYEPSSTFNGSLGLISSLNFLQNAFNPIVLDHALGRCAT